MTVSTFFSKLYRQLNYKLKSKGNIKVDFTLRVEPKLWHQFWTKRIWETNISERTHLKFLLQT